MIKIDKNIPPPPTRVRYPIANMEVGDSFLIPNCLHGSISGRIAYSMKKHGYTFRTKKEGGGVRVWRTS